jgi:accessory colonization factor AcfC
MRRAYCFLLLGGLVLGALLTAGCSGTVSRVQMDYGTSYQLAKYNQILNPGAEKNLDPVYGFDGEAARATIQKYEKSFEKETVAPVYSINVGGFR